MFDPSNTLIESLISYGIEEDAAKIYLYTSTNGPSTALKIGKELHINRTRVYRLLDKLLYKGLIAQRMGDRGFVFVAEPSDRFRLLIKEKELELHSLKEDLPYLSAQLDTLIPKGVEKSNVIYYEGTRGLKQVTWNSLKAKDTLRILEISSDMSAFLDQEFSEEVRRELVNRKIHVKQLTNLTEIPSYTKVTEMITNFWEVKHIHQEDLKISFETLIYNDVVTLYNTKGREVFCVEIHDSYLANMQRDMFDFIWKNAKEMLIKDEFGNAILWQG